MSQSTNIVLTQLAELNDRSKLFLLLLVAKNEARQGQSLSTPIYETGLELSRKLGISKGATFAALKELESLGIVESFSVTEGVGRPRKLRKLISDSWGREVLLKAVNAPLTPVCEKVITGRLRASNKFPLANSLFMLLLVLLMHSDLRGIISRLSHTEFSELTGIPKQQIPVRLKQLRKRGLLKETVHGLVDGDLLGPVKSVYYLNMEHPLLMSAGLKSTPLTLKRGNIPGVEIQQLTSFVGQRLPQERLTNPEASLQRKEIPNKIRRLNPSSWKTNARNILARESARQYLQSAVERHAAYLLDNPRKINDRTEWRESKDICSSEFLECIAHQSLPFYANDPARMAMRRQLLADLEELSHGLAQYCLQCLKMQGINLTETTPGTHYRILPSQEKIRKEIRLELIEIRFTKDLL